MILVEGRRTINVPLGSSAGLPPVDARARDPLVDRFRDGLVGLGSRVLVDQRGPSAIVSHPGLQVGEAGAGSGEHVAGARWSP